METMSENRERWRTRAIDAGVVVFTGITIAVLNGDGARLEVLILIATLATGYLTGRFPKRTAGDTS